MKHGITILIHRNRLYALALLLLGTCSALFLSSSSRLTIPVSFFMGSYGKSLTYVDTFIWVLGLGLRLDHQLTQLKEDNTFYVGHAGVVNEKWDSATFAEPRCL